MGWIVNNLTAAVFFDGEGCVMIHRQASKRVAPVYDLRATIAQAGEDPAFLAEFQAIWGGHLYRYSRGGYHKSGWEWGVTGKRAGKFMQDIAPYARLKKEQVELALLFNRHLTAYNLASIAKLKNRDDELLERIRNERQEMRERMRELKWGTNHPRMNNSVGK